MDTFFFFHSMHFISLFLSFIPELRQTKNGRNDLVSPHSAANYSHASNDGSNDRRGPIVNRPALYMQLMIKSVSRIYPRARPG